MRRIIYGLLASLLVVGCSSVGSRDLDQSVPYRLSAYSSLLPKILFRSSPRDFYLRMICFPSFDREWGVAIAAPEGERTTVEYVIAERSIWHAPRPQDISIDRRVAHMTKATAQRLHEAWTQVLQRPERMQARNFNADGVACRFDSSTTEGGRLSVETWTSRSEYPAGVLVELGEMVRDLTQAEESTQPMIEHQISRKAQDLLAWSRNMERPTNMPQPELQAMVPDRVGLTVQRSPVLYFYLSHVTSLPMRFTLRNSRNVAPVVDVLLKSPSSPGIQALRLDEYNIVLEEDVQYRWFVSLIMDADSPSRDIVAGGVIERIDPRLVDYYGNTCDRESVLRAEKAGLWIDAFACVNELIEGNPEDPSLRDLRDELLGRQKSILHLLSMEPQYLGPSREKQSQRVSALNIAA